MPQAARAQEANAKSGHENVPESIPAPRAPKIPPISRRSESERIREALEKHRWNHRKVSEELGISYQTLRRRIEKYNLNRPR